MGPDFEIVDIPPSEQPLFDALSQLGIPNRRLIQAVVRLIKPPESLCVLPRERVETMNSILVSVNPFDGDVAARMLALQETGRPDPNATWKALTRTQRKRARLLWYWASDTGFGTARRGRPTEVDAALVLYSCHVIVEECGGAKFRFSRPATGGRPGGPMWRALIAALPLAESYLARIDGHNPPSLKIEHHIETIAEIITASRTKQFAARCRELGFKENASDIAKHPDTYRHAVMIARSKHRAPRRG
jgi:hypothetical protein